VFVVMVLIAFYKVGIQYFGLGWIEARIKTTRGKIYAKYDVDVTNALEFVHSLEELTEERITIVHLGMYKPSLSLSVHAKTNITYCNIKMPQSFINMYYIVYAALRLLLLFAFVWV